MYQNYILIMGNLQIYREDDVVDHSVEVVYGKDSQQRNLKAIANTLEGKRQQKEVIRNHFLTGFHTNYRKGTLKEFDGLVQHIFFLALLKTREIKRLDEIRDTLLPKLMSGKLDVFDIEFQAAKLLFI